MTGERSLDGGAPAWLSGGLPVWTAATSRAYTDSTLFSGVAVGLADADLHAVVRVVRACRDEPADALKKTLSMMTAGLVPALIGERVTLHTEVRDAGGRVVGVFEREERARAWGGLLMLPVLPFRSHRAEIDAIVYDLNRTVIEEARAAGAL